MSKNYRNERTINSYLAARKGDIRNKQIAELEKYVLYRKEKNRKVLQFIKYWGASNKESLDKQDYEALFNLFGFLKIIEKHYKLEVHLTIIFTDTHVILNGYNSEKFKKYFKEVREILNEFNYSHVLMSEVLMPFIKQHKLKDANDLINSIIVDSISEIPQDIICTESFELLKKSASKHSFRFTNNQIFGDLKFNSIDHSAYAYIKLNRIEKLYVEKNFFQSVFLTYTSHEEQKLIAPSLPILQIFSSHKGRSVRPWFSNNIKKDIE